MEHKPYHPSCDENRDPILAVLRPRMTQARRVLEIGSGTGQHAVYFAPALPHLTWQTSDVEHQLLGIRLWLADHPAANLPPPIALDVGSDNRLGVVGEYDTVFSANTAHMMDETTTKAMVLGIAELLPARGRFFWYGPFKKRGRFNGPNDREFDRRLRARNPGTGLKDIAWLEKVAATGDIQLVEEVAMPAHNFTLVWQKNSRVDS